MILVVVLDTVLLLALTLILILHLILILALILIIAIPSFSLIVLIVTAVTVTAASFAGSRAIPWAKTIPVVIPPATRSIAAVAATRLYGAIAVVTATATRTVRRPQTIVPLLIVRTSAKPWPAAACM